MKIEDALRLDCRHKENRKFLIKQFKKIPYIKRNLEDIKDMDELKLLTEELAESMRYSYNTLSHHERRYYTLAIYDRKYREMNSASKIHTLYALDKREIYFKICVFCYYNRKLQKKNSRNKRSRDEED